MMRKARLAIWKVNVEEDGPGYYLVPGRSLICSRQVSFAETELTKIITIYEPDPNEWVDYRRRS